MTLKRCVVHIPCTCSSSRWFLAATFMFHVILRDGRVRGPLHKRRVFLISRRPAQLETQDEPGSSPHCFFSDYVNNETGAMDHLLLQPVRVYRP